MNPEKFNEQKEKYGEDVEMNILLLRHVIGSTIKCNTCSKIQVL